MINIVLVKKYNSDTKITLDTGTLKTSQFVVKFKY